MSLFLQREKTYNYFNNNFLYHHHLLFHEHPYDLKVCKWKLAFDSANSVIFVIWKFTESSVWAVTYGLVFLVCILRKLSMTFFQDKYSGLLNVFFYIYIFYWHLVMMRMSLCQSQLQWELAEMRSNFFLYCNQEKKLSNQIWLWLSTTYLKRRSASSRTANRNNNNDPAFTFTFFNYLWTPFWWRRIDWK